MVLQTRFYFYLEEKQLRAHMKVSVFLTRCPQGHIAAPIREDTIYKRDLRLEAWVSLAGTSKWIRAQKHEHLIVQIICAYGLVALRSPALLFLLLLFLKKLRRMKVYQGMWYI